MDYTELASTITELANDLSATAPDTSWATVIHFVDHGEPEEAVDLMIAAIVELPALLTPTQHDRVRALMNHFGFSSEDSHYRYLGDPEMLDRMTVVDGPSS